MNDIYKIDYSKIFYPVAHRPQGYIDSFSTRYESFDENIIPQIIKEYTGELPQKVEQASGWGTSHVIYFATLKNGRELVFRANSGKTNPEEPMLIEKVIAEKLVKHNIPTNIILHADITRQKYGFDYQIEEKFVGIDIESAWDTLKNKKGKYDKFSYDLGVLIAKMSSIPVDNFGLFDINEAKQGKLVGYHQTFYDYLSCNLQDDLEQQVGYFIDGSQVDTILDLFEKRKSLLNSLDNSIVHHDLADHNIAVNIEPGEITALFDWEAACAGSPLLDLASCPTWSTIFPREQILLDGYKSVKALPDEWREVFDILKLRTVIWKNLFAVRAGFLKPKHSQRWIYALEPYKMKPTISKTLLKD